MLSLFDIKYNTIDSTYLSHIKPSLKKAVLYIYILYLIRVDIVLDYFLVSG